MLAVLAVASAPAPVASSLPGAIPPALERLEKRVLSAMLDSDLYGPSPSAALGSTENFSVVDDYRVTRLRLSPGRPLFAALGEFEFRPLPRLSLLSRLLARSRPAQLVPESSCVERLVCSVDRYYEHLEKWQHYVQKLFPCWSLFQRFPHAKHYVELDSKIAPSGREWHSWIAQLNAAFAAANVTFLPRGAKTFDSRALPLGGRGCEWVAESPGVIAEDFGWADPHGEGPLRNFRYFMSRADIAALQKHVLGSSTFQPGPSTDHHQIRLLILDRQDEPAARRRWLYSNETFDRVRRAWAPLVNARLIPSFKGHVGQVDAWCFGEVRL